MIRKLVSYKGGLDDGHDYNMDDAITGCRYSRDGQHLAVSDDSGRIVVFDSHQSGQLSFACEIKAKMATQDWTSKREIKSSVVSLEWLDRSGSRLYLLGAGGRSIKLWKIVETSKKQILNAKNIIPQLREEQLSEYYSSEMKQFPILHSNPIKSINLSQNQESVLSTDGKTLLRWNLDRTDQPHLVFTAPHSSSKSRKSEPVSRSESMEVEQTNDQERELQKDQEEYQLSEWNAVNYITNAKFHSHYDNKLAYSTKLGGLNYLDLRTTNSTKPSLMIETEQSSSFLKKYLNLISDFDFLQGGYEVVTRDLLSTKIYDLRNPSKYVQKFSVYPSLVNKISELYDQERHDDQFPLVVSPDGRRFLTGHYQSAFHQIHYDNHQNIRYEIDDKNCSIPSMVTNNIHSWDNFDPDPKISCLSYNPNGKHLCAAVRDSLFVFSS